MVASLIFSKSLIIGIISIIIYIKLPFLRPFVSNSSAASSDNFPMYRFLEFYLTHGFFFLRVVLYKSSDGPS